MSYNWCKMATILNHCVMQENTSFPLIWVGALFLSLSTCELISLKQWSKLSERDQRAFDGWTEGVLNFTPTYKYEMNPDKYYGLDPKVGRRIPAWCGRILSYGKGMKLLKYRRTELKLSDHRSVTATYMAEAEVFSPRKLQRELTYTNAEIENEEVVEASVDVGMSHLRLEQGHQGLEGKILGVFDFKNRNRISITDCLKEFDKSDSHYETLTKLKKRGKQQGQKLFRLGVRWMLYMSEAGYDFVQKMKVVADSLEWLCDGENAVVIDKFVHLLQTADTQLILDSNIDVQQLGEDDTDEEMLWLMKEILGLELLWMHRGLWNSKMSLAKDALPSLLSDMTDLECEIGKEPLTEGSDEFKAMLPKIDELWTQIGEVDKKERKVIDFQKLKKLLDDSIYQTNIKELYQKFNSAQAKGIHGFEHKIHALLHNGDNDCKNDQERERMKITFLECSDVEYNPFEESLENLESRAIEHGHNLFNVAIDLMFLMPSKSRIDKLQVVMKSLAWICEGEEDIVVIERFIELVKTLLETRMHKFNKKVSKRQKKAVMRSENKVEEEEVILSEEEEDETIIALMRAIIRLEIVLRATDEADMVKCEVLLATLMRKVKRFGKESRLKAIKRTAEYKALLSKKMELWGVQISEKLN